MRTCLSIYLVALLSVVCPGEQSQRWEPGKTFVFIVGVLDWQQDSLTTYAKESRQDVALRDQLIKRGVPPENVSLLLDRDATLAAIQRELVAITKRAGADSTLIIYYAGHGMLEKGRGVFANFDIDTRRALETGWTHDSIADVISENFSGKRVLFFADCCYSGALESAVNRLSSNGLRAACLTSASSSNLSTSNWTFTLTLIDLMKGQTLADADQDGSIDFHEAGLEVAQSMRFFEDQRCGYAFAGLNEEFVIADVMPRRISGKIPAPLRRGQYVNVAGGGNNAVARVVDADATGRLVVRFRDYSRFRETVVAAEHARPMSAAMDSGEPVALPVEEAKRVASWMENIPSS